MEIILKYLACILFILLALGNFLAFVNHCRNGEKIKMLENRLNDVENKLQIKFEDINNTFNNICFDISVNDNDMKNIKDFIGYKDSFERLQFANYYADVIKRFFKSDQWTNDDFEAFTSIPISADILETGIESYIENAIKKALQVSEKILEPFAKKYEKRLENPDPIVKKIQAESLPEGWIGVECSYKDDFDVHLENPEGNHYFNYDIMTGEYKVTSDSNLDFFLNENYETGKYERASLSEFQTFEYVKENILNKE